MKRRHTRATTAKLGVDTVEMLRRESIAPRGSSVTLDDAIWQLAERAGVGTRTEWHRWNDSEGIGIPVPSDGRQAE